MDTQERDRMITIGELSAILAHEIKNPMNSIIINIEVLRNAVMELAGADSSAPATRARKYLDVIEGEIRRLDKVIRGFQDFANPSQSTKIKLKLNPVIQNIADFLRNEMEQKKVTLALHLDSELPAIIGSADQIKQALLNLLLNALQALPRGGKISVTTQSNETDIKVIVEDNGIGMEDSVIDKIFTPYFTTKTKGSGLGLTVVNRIAKDHGGKIRVQSQLGKGSTFTLSFPRIQIAQSPSS